MAANVFEFANHNVEVSIAGENFVMDCSIETGDYLQQVARNLREIAEEIKNKTKTADDAVAYGVEVVDHLLGNGAADKIFKNRKKNLDDMSDLCLFLTQIGVEYQQKRRETKGKQKRAGKK